MQRMSITKYKALLKVIECGSITKAAEYLGYTQPGISHMILSLEKENGFPLLIRNKDHVAPTENATLLLPFYQQIVSQHEYANETINKINGVSMGTIRIGAYNSLLIHWVPKIIKHFANRHPLVSISVVEYSYVDLCRQLTNNYIDMAFMVDDVPEGFDFIPLLEDEIKVILPKGHPLCKMEKVSVSAIEQYNFLMPAAGFDDHMKIVLEDEPFQPNGIHHVGSDNALISMVSEGLGITVLPEMLIENACKEVVSKSFYHNKYRTMGIAIRSAKNTSPAVKEFLSIANEITKEIVE